MAKGRDPSIGLEWLAWHAMERGDEDPEKLVEYLDDVWPKFSKFVSDNHNKIPRSDAEMLSALSLIILGMRMALRRNKEFAMRLTLERRTAGKPVDRTANARAGHAAAAMVERLVAQGEKQEAAIAFATEKTGLGRASIFSWLKARRKVRTMAERAQQK